MKSREFLRWRLRRIAGRTPALRARSKNSSSPYRVAYLFNGTYGDMAQALPAIWALRRRFSECPFLLMAQPEVLWNFRHLLPFRTQSLSPYSWPALLIRPANLLVMNAVSGYKVWALWIGQLMSRRCVGFYYPDEPMPRFFATGISMGVSRNFAKANLQLLVAAGLAEDVQSPWFHQGLVDTLKARALRLSGKSENAESHPSVLFHAGAKSVADRMGKSRYEELVELITTDLLKLGASIQWLHGARENGLKHRIQAAVADRTGIQTGAKLTFVTESVEKLAFRILRHEGQILCFNSFMAHYCMLLGRRATVLYYPDTPEGYDCSSIHRQLRADLVFHPDARKVLLKNVLGSPIS